MAERRGLSPEQFVKRVQESGSVVQNWPFENVPDVSKSTSRYSYDVLRNRKKKALVVGKIIFDNETFNYQSLLMKAKDEWGLCTLLQIAIYHGS